MGPTSKGGEGRGGRGMKGKEKKRREERRKRPPIRLSATVCHVMSTASGYKSSSQYYYHTI